MLFSVWSSVTRHELRIKYESKHRERRGDHIAGIGKKAHVDLEDGSLQKCRFPSKSAEIEVSSLFAPGWSVLVEVSSYMPSACVIP